MKKRSQPRKYILVMLDEKGNEWGKEECYNDLRPRTASFLLVNFRMFKTLLLMFNALLGFVIGKFISGLL